MTGLTALDRRLLLLLTALRLAAAALTPLAPDEAYYRVWAHALAPGYLDHPPMVAIWIGAGTALAGDTKLGIRLLGPFAALLGTLLLANAANALRPGTARAAAGLLNGTLLLNAGTIILTPDTPLLFFWTATLWAMARLIARNNAAWWLAAGAAAGLALDSKYTAALLAPALLLWLLLPANRHRPCWPGTPSTIGPASPSKVAAKPICTRCTRCARSPNSRWASSASPPR